MLKTAELLELTDEDLLSLVGTDVVVRLSWRGTEPDENDEEEVPPFKTVTAAGKLIELQFSGDTGGAIAYMYSGAAQPDELRWDCDDYRAEFIWVHKD